MQILLVLLVLALLTGYSGAESPSGGPASCMVLVTSTEGGTVSPFGANSVPSGSSISFTMTPQLGYEIDHVMVDLVDKGPVQTLNISPVTHDMAVHVIFGPSRNPMPDTLQPVSYRELEQPVTPAPTHITEKNFSSSIITVGKTGGDFSRIQDAITNALSGTTIQIEPGRYDEQLIITKPLTLTGKEGAEKPIVSAGLNGTAILITANQVNLNSLNITGSGMEGNDLMAAVSGTGIRDISIENCDISGSQNGLMIAGSENVTITGSNISNINRNGITFTSTGEIRITQTKISGCRTDLTGENITHLYMHRNQITDSEENGVLFTKIKDSVISGDIVSENSKVLNVESANPGAGLHLSSPRNVTITENQIVSNLGMALRLDQPANIIVTNNTLRNNAAGFSCIGESKETNRIDQSNTIDNLPILYYEGVDGKTIENVSPGVMYLMNCSDITVQNIVMATRNGYGIVARGGSNLSIHNTSVGENLYQNILISGVAGGSVTGTSVHNSSRYGLGISDSKNFRISDNEIRNNGIGVAIRGISSEVNLSDNTFSGDQIGFQILDGYSLSGFGELTRNKISNGNVGISSLSGGRGVIRQNQILDVTEGMNLSGSQELLIEENRIDAGETGVSMARGKSRPDNTVQGSRAAFGNSILRNSVNAANPLLFRDSSEWIYGNTFVLNDFTIKSADSPLNQQTIAADSEDVWGGFDPATPDMTELVNNQQTELVETSNTWDTNERVRYTYGNSTFSGYLGNHWSNYSGKEIGASGVGDTPYTVNADNIDQYPLIGQENQYKTGEGGYILELAPGWNFISTPWILASGHNTAEIFSNIDSARHSVYSFNNDTWIPIKADDPIQPLHGFWLYTTNQATVPLIFDPGTVPTPVHLKKGWNMIGFPGIQAAPAGDALSSLDESWSYVMGYNAKIQRYDPPIFRGTEEATMMYPSCGYWIHLDQEWNLQPITG